jgi:hypothetical protein
MKKNGAVLSAHSADGFNATWDEVVAAPIPEATRSHKPFAHAKFIDMVRTEVSQFATIKSERFALAHGQMSVFGVMDLAFPNNGADEEYGVSLGLRNSNAKKFPAGLCLGSHVFVCDNLAFSAEQVLSRRHTVYMILEMPKLVHAAASTLLGYRAQQEDDLDIMRRATLTDTMAHDLLVRGLDAGAYGTQALPAVLQEYREPTYDDFAKTHNVWRFFNAATHILKSAPTLELPDRTSRLHAVCVDAARGITS